MFKIGDILIGLPDKEIAPAARYFITNDECLVKIVHSEIGDELEINRVMVLSTKEVDKVKYIRCTYGVLLKYFRRATKKDIKSFKLKLTLPKTIKNWTLRG